MAVMELDPTFDRSTVNAELAAALTDEALAVRLEDMAASPRTATRSERDAYLNEAAGRLRGGRARAVRGAVEHPIRLRILLAIDAAEQEELRAAEEDERKAKSVRMSPNQLSGELGASLGTVAYHVRTLKDRKLIAMTGEARVRGAVEHFYGITPKGRELLAGL